MTNTTTIHVTENTATGQRRYHRTRTMLERDRADRGAPELRAWFE